LTGEIAAGPSLATLVALIRAGARSKAWSLFQKYYGGSDDPNALRVYGRLLKDRAALAAPQDATIFFRGAAAAYRKAAETACDTYSLINAASLSLLAGEQEEATRLSQQVLDSIDVAPDEPETPYWRAATRAEAFLLLGRFKQSRAALADAIALAPRAWEDHASTLRQFKLILEAQGRDASWLDAHRPPRSLHFGGHMSFDAATLRREHLNDRIAAALEEERIGFGYGALAAGADIIIAEALVARGSELHAVLPGGAEAFAAVSVDPFGAEWRRRFHALIERAENVRSVRPIGTSPNSQMIGLADEIAMGAAAMNARRLESEAVQLLVLDAGTDEGGAGATRRARTLWAEAGRRQHLIEALREAVETTTPPSTAGADGSRSLTVLAVRLDPDSGLDVEMEERLGQLRGSIASAGAPQVGPYWVGDGVLLAYDRLREAAGTAAALAGRGLPRRWPLSCSIAVQRSFLRRRKAAGGGDRGGRSGGGVDAAGSACVTEDFAAALVARAGTRLPSNMWASWTRRTAARPFRFTHSNDQLLEPVRRHHGQRFGVAADDAAALQRIHRARGGSPVSWRPAAQARTGQARD
jgi:hypothetical protein